MSNTSSNIVPLRAGQAPYVFANRANLPDMNKQMGQGLAPGFAVIGTKGRNWRIKYRGEEELVMDGRNPVPSLDVVIVGVSPFVSKTYYIKGFEQDSAEAPDCFSVNGITPDVSAKVKQCATCAACQKNEMGSKISDAGKKVKACQDNRRIAVVPLGDINNESYGGPMMLKLPYKSLAKLRAYGAEMTKFDAQPFMVGTRLSFDLDVTYQLLNFEALGWLTEDQATQVAKVMTDPLIPQMLETDAAEAQAAPVAEPATPVSALAGGRPASAFVAAQTQAPIQEDVQSEVKAPTPAPTIDYAAIQAETEAKMRAEAEARMRAEIEARVRAEMADEVAKAEAQTVAHQPEAPVTQAPVTAPKKTGSAFATGTKAAVNGTAPPAQAAPAVPAQAQAQVPYASDELDAAVDDLLAS